MRRLAAFIILTLTMAAFVAPAAATVNGATRTFAYDARGNVTSNGPTGFTYDFANQPLTVTGAGAATYLYDGNLKRVKEVRAGKTVYNIYSRATGGLAIRSRVCGRRPHRSRNHSRW